MSVRDILQKYAAEGPKRATYFLDLKGKAPEFGHLADEPMPCASVIKLAVAMALYKSGQDLSQRVPIASLNQSLYCSLFEVFEHTKDVSLGELANIMLIISDNPATTEITKRVGMDNVNKLMRNLGCSKHAMMAMDFSDRDETADWRSNILTARDCGILLREIATNPVYKRLRHLLVHSLRNNRLAAKLPEQVQIAHKTGTISGMANDAALVTEGPPATSPVEYILVCLWADEVPNSVNNAQGELGLAVHKAMMEGHPHAAPQHRIWLHESAVGS
ncbi:MAG: serine hydrolase [Bdellovibrionales bacterium]